MPVDVIMPPLSQTMDSVVLAKWLKSVGDPVTKGEPLFSIETDKAVLDVEAPADGTLAQIVAPQGSEVLIHHHVFLVHFVVRHLQWSLSLREI